MTATINQTATIMAPRNASERLALANALYREYHTRCFWHSPHDLVITAWTQRGEGIMRAEVTCTTDGSLNHLSLE